MVRITQITRSVYVTANILLCFINKNVPNMQYAYDSVKVKQKKNVTIINIVIIIIVIVVIVIIIIVIVIIFVIIGTSLPQNTCRVN